ncbi:hypothetical protein B0T25DRAFT_585842 [Lasiosphaeria hispida]|uniref:Uncharacterized protein n=1 Tax=Lasiosphaeria hispida TaxID=260671 RepID=A0AAJ0H6T7_9PEZI|nr:hypothetical protein B0T25DRAFT_585842 [Lasiosphaeria hispida]
MPEMEDNSPSAFIYAPRNGYSVSTMSRLVHNQVHASELGMSVERDHSPTPISSPYQHDMGTPGSLSMSRQRRSMAPTPPTVPHFKPISWQPINWQRTLPDYGAGPEAHSSSVHDVYDPTTQTMPREFSRHRVALEGEEISPRATLPPPSRPEMINPGFRPVRSLHAPAPILTNSRMTDITPVPEQQQTMRPSSFTYTANRTTATTNPLTPSPTSTATTTTTTDWTRRRLEQVYHICLAATDRFIARHTPPHAYSRPRQLRARFAPYPPHSPPPPYSRYPAPDGSALVGNANAVCGILWPRGALLTSTRARMMTDVLFWAETVGEGIGGEEDEGEEDEEGEEGEEDEGDEGDEEEEEEDDQGWGVLGAAEELCAFLEDREAMRMLGRITEEWYRS